MSTTTVDQTAPSRSRRFFDDSLLWVLGSIQAMGLDPVRAKQVMGMCQVHEFTLKLLRDNASELMVPGTLVLWWPGDQRNSQRGAKGGTRMVPVADLWLAQALALLMMIKCYMLGLPFDGAKCAIQINPDKLSTAERRRLGVAYAEWLIESGIGGPHGYVTASDVGSGEFDMDSICLGFQSKYGELAAACVTGKTGAIGRRGSTGYFAAREAEWTADQLMVPHDERTASVQGILGKVGYWTAYFLHKAGWRVQSASELIDGQQVAIFVEDGIDPEALRQYVGEHGRANFVNFPGARRITMAEFFGLRVTSLVLAAVELAVDVAEAEIIGARSLSVPANGGVSYPAGRILHSRGIWFSLVGASGGGVGVSWLEWLLALGKFEQYSLASPPSEETVLRLVEERLWAARQAKLQLMIEFPKMNPGEAEFAVAFRAIMGELDRSAVAAA